MLKMNLSSILIPRMNNLSLIAILGLKISRLNNEKIKRLKPLYALTVLLAFAAAIWAMYNGKTDLITILMGGVSAF